MELFYLKIVQLDLVYYDIKCGCGIFDFLQCKGLVVCVIIDEEIVEVVDQFLQIIWVWLCGEFISVVQEVGCDFIVDWVYFKFNDQVQCIVLCKDLFWVVDEWVKWLIVSMQYY